MLRLFIRSLVLFILSAHFFFGLFTPMYRKKHTMSCLQDKKKRKQKSKRGQREEENKSGFTFAAWNAIDKKAARTR
jgi:uncharacterized ion transporter superfamily protein YfcC